MIVPCPDLVRPKNLMEVPSFRLSEKTKALEVPWALRSPRKVS